MDYWSIIIPIVLFHISLCERRFTMTNVHPGVIALVIFGLTYWAFQWYNNRKKAAMYREISEKLNTALTLLFEANELSSLSFGARRHRGASYRDPPVYWVHMIGPTIDFTIEHRSGGKLRFTRSCPYDNVILQDALQVMQELSGPEANKLLTDYVRQAKFNQDAIVAQTTGVTSVSKHHRVNIGHLELSPR
jgi:hypothetical protein